MSNKLESSYNNELTEKSMEYEFDFKQMYLYLYKNKKFLGYFCLSGIVLSSIVAFSLKKIWKGEFQIVLKPNQSISSARIQNPLRLGLNLGNRFNPLLTEVGILESPSVLMSVFEFVKNEKVLKVKNNFQKAKIQELKFQDWKKNNLKIALQKNTSILNLSYRDTDKDIIMPVLNKISKKYQDYSGKEKLRDLELSSNFLTKQVEIYKNKSKKSFKEAQEFAIKYDLSNVKSLDTNFSDKNTLGIIDSNFSINVEELRIKAINKIRIINEELKQFKNSANNSEYLSYYASTIPAIQDLYKNLKDTDILLSELRGTYKNSDKRIQNELRKRKILIEVINKQVKGILEAEKITAEALLKASERPDGVVIEYRQLLDKAVRDKATLFNLENQLRAISLEQAKTRDPWELITTPTLYPDAIGPKKKQIVFTGLIGSLFLGVVSSFTLKKNKDKVLTANEAESILGFPLLNELIYPDNKNWDHSLEVLIKSPLIKNKSNLGFLLLGDLKNIGLKNLKDIVQKYDKSSEFKFSENILDLEEFIDTIIITSLESIKKSQLIDLKKKLLIQKKNVLGFILLENFSKK